MRRTSKERRKFAWSADLPEYPDITVYIERLEALVKGQMLEQVRLASPFLLRTIDPPLSSIFNASVSGFERIGKRIVFVFPDDYFLVIHLMIAGRLHWREKGAKMPGKIGLAAFDFSNGTLLLTEAGTKKRASLHLVKGRDNLQEFNAGGLEVLEASFEEFKKRLQSENHTLKRSLTDPRLFSGIGNAYSDEILHRAGLSPIQLTMKLTDQQMEQLYAAIRNVLLEWTQKLRVETGERFPEKVTAFHDDIAVHGRFGKPCPACSTPIQRIRYAENETNYCPRCQTGGKILADRSLSQLLKSDWPRTIEEMEQLQKNRLS